jgi:hypothetical protein
MLNYEFSLEAVARTLAWIALMAPVAGFCWAAGASLYGRMSQWKARSAG